MIPWQEKNFNQWQQEEIELCRLYGDKLAHNHPDGVSLRLIVAKMAEMLDKCHYNLAPIGSAHHAPYNIKRIAAILRHEVVIDESLPEGTIKVSNVTITNIGGGYDT